MSDDISVPFWRRLADEDAEIRKRRQIDSLIRREFKKRGDRGLVQFLTDLKITLSNNGYNFHNGYDWTTEKLVARCEKLGLTLTWTTK